MNATAEVERPVKDRLGLGDLALGSADCAKVAQRGDGIRVLLA